MRTFATTTSGLGTLAGDQWKPVAHAGLGEDAQTVAVDAKGRVWVAGGEAVWRLEGGKWAEVNLTGAAEVGEVRGIVPDAEGGVWLLTAQGLLRRR